MPHNIYYPELGKYLSTPVKKSQNAPIIENKVDIPAPTSTKKRSRMQNAKSSLQQNNIPSEENKSVEIKSKLSNRTVFYNKPAKK